MSQLPPDGSLSGEQPGPADGFPEMPDELARLIASRPVQPPPSGWRPMCCPCLNGHKMAIIELTQKLLKQGLQMGDQQFMQAMHAAQQAGAMFAQNPMAAQGMNGAKPDMIPPVRPADVIVNGTTCCALCFTPQKNTSLIVANSGWTPRG